jgi:hypothetical protein
VTQRRRLKIRVHGGGVSAIAAATLLRVRGADVRVSVPACARGRIVAIPVETLALMRDLLGIGVESLRLGRLVQLRRVDWSNSTASVVPQVALVCDTADLVAELATPLGDAGCLEHDDTGTNTDDDADWVIEASGRPVGGAPVGNRVGQFARIATLPPAPQIMIAATSVGWFFAAPHPIGGTAVLLVSPTAALCAVTGEDVVDRLAGTGIRTSASEVMELSKPKSIAPALADPISSGRRLSVGDAAFALDPLRGDGVGFALRGALLAQAVVARIDAGSSSRAECLGYYNARLRRAFVSHVRGCREHYTAARHAEIWKHELAEMDMVVIGGRTAARKELAFRMQGRDLVSAAHWTGGDFAGHR